MTEPSDNIDFEQAKQRFLQGLNCFESGRFDQAEQHFLASLEAMPRRASTLINLAATQLQQEHSQDALATANAALEVEPNSTEALLHRATALLQLERLTDALDGFDRLLEFDATMPEGWLRRARTLERLGRAGEALGSFERVLALDPKHFEAWSGRGSLLRELQRPDEAAHAFRQALLHGADPEIHAYYLASVDGGRAPSTAPRKYVESLFNDYAAQFDQHLVGALHYAAHTQLIAGLVDSADGRYANTLDLGCGTGLCGPLVRPMTDRLTGVDLAPAMLLRAHTLGAYDKLVKMDGVQYLERSNDRFDLILAADVFIYIGDLGPIFAAARKVMDQGVFCFSIEELDDSQGDFHLLPSLRYAHSHAYVRRLCSDYDFKSVATIRAPIREEQGRSIQGLYVYLSVSAT